MLGLLDSPHVSAGRIPTQLGLRLFVDGILEVGDVSGAERTEIERVARRQRARHRRAFSTAPATCCRASPTARASCWRRRPRRRSGISSSSSLAPDRALVVLVTADGARREPAVHAARRAYALGDAGGRQLPQRDPPGPHARRDARRRSPPRSRSAAPSSTRSARSLIEDGVAVWSEDRDGGRDRLIVRGQANLLDGADDAAQLERIRVAVRRPRAQARPRAASRPDRGRRRASVSSSARRTSFFHFPVPLWWSLPI